MDFAKPRRHSNTNNQHMNTATPDLRFGEFNIPGRVTSRPMSRIRKPGSSGEEGRLLHVLKLEEPLDPVEGIAEESHPVLSVDRTVVSASILRRIENELRHDDCDPRTVLRYCRGLARGSLEFEDAYFAARIRAFAKHQRIATVFYLTTNGYAGDVTPNPGGDSMNEQFMATHPLAVNHLGHLMSHLGIWVMGLFGIQMWAALRVSAYASANLEGGRPFHFMMMLLVILAINTAFWLRLRGKLCDAFLIPGIVLYLMAALPIFLLHLRGIQSAMW